MRITNKLLRAHCGVKQCSSLNNIEYLDLSEKGIVLVERLNQCPKLHTLLLAGNQIDVLENLNNCPQLWRLDVSNNKIRYLDGLREFVGLGTLNLSHNQLTWPELAKIRHMFLLDIHLHGNPDMEKDPNYRLHVIDCLPQAAAVDGRPVTSSERCQVAHFFQKSACTDKPVRHKLPRDRFVPTSHQNLHVRGVYGDRVSQFCALFPANSNQHGKSTDNLDTDRKKLMFFAKNLQEELLFDVKFRKKDYRVVKRHGKFMEELLTIRPEDREGSNMLLLLLVASLEFVLPATVVEKSLEVTHLDIVGSFETMSVFLLPRDVRWSVAAILLTAAKLDREDQQESCLYQQLYTCLHCVLSDLVRVRYMDTDRAKSARARGDGAKKDHRSLLASELVQLMCIVPVFYQLIDTDMGVMNLIVTATGDAQIIDKLSQHVSHIPSSKNLAKVYQEIADHLLAAMQHHSTKLFTRAYKHRRNMEKHLMASTTPIRPMSSPIHKSEYLTSGRTLPTPTRVQSGRARKEERKIPRLGDEVLLGPQTMGRVVSVPQNDVIVVLMSAIPVANGSMISSRDITKTSADFFRYVSMNDVTWDADAGYWRPEGTVGDRITIQSICKEADVIFDSSVSSVSQHAPSLGHAPSADPKTTPQNNGSLILTRSQASAEQAAKPRLFEFPRPISCVLAEKLDLKLDINDQDNKRRPFSENEQQEHQLTEQDSNLFTTVQDAVLTVASNITTRSDSAESHRPPSRGKVVWDDQKAAAKAQSTDDEMAIVMPSTAEEENSDHSKTQTPTEENGGRHSNPGHHSNDLEQTWSEIEREHNLENGDQKEALKELHDAASSIMQYRFINEGESVSIGEAYRYLISKPERQTKSAHVTSSRGGVTSRDHVTASKALIGQLREEAAFYKTPYQMERAQSWLPAKSPRKSPKKEKQPLVSIPPPQRPCSPSGSNIADDGTGMVVIDDHSSCIRRVDGWLGGGKDLYSAELQSRPRRRQQPGWKEGLRTKSALSGRAKPRAQTALTPSSINFINAYGAVNGYNPRDPTRDVTSRPRDQTTRRIVYPSHTPPTRPGPVCAPCRVSPRPISGSYARPISASLSLTRPISDEDTTHVTMDENGHHHVVRFEFPHSR